MWIWKSYFRVIIILLSIFGHIIRKIKKYIKIVYSSKTCNQLISRLVKTRQNQKFRDQALGGTVANRKRKKTDDIPSLSKKEVDSALLRLQLFSGINIRVVEDGRELAMLVSTMTKAVAEAPFK